MLKQTLSVFNIEIWKESGGYAILKKSKRNDQILPGKENGLEFIRIAGRNNGI